MKNIAVFLLGSLLLLMGCEQAKENKVVTLSITTWVGNYPFFYAIENGLDKKHGIELRIIETMTVQDFRRTNVKDHVDGFAASVMELTQSNLLFKEPIQIALINDFSNGADVIIAKKQIANVSELQGKRIGFEWQALGHYFINLAFAESGIELPEFEHVVTEQVAAKERFNDDLIDAYITYPPISTDILQDDSLHQIFDSSAIPNKVLDFIAVKHHVDKPTVEALQQIWQDSLTLAQENPETYLRFAATQMQVTPELAKSELSGVELLDLTSQNKISHEELWQVFDLACQTLDDAYINCQKALKKIYYQEKSVAYDRDSKIMAR